MLFPPQQFIQIWRDLPLSVPPLESRKLAESKEREIPLPERDSGPAVRDAVSFGFLLWQQKRNRTAGVAGHFDQVGFRKSIAFDLL